MKKEILYIWFGDTLPIYAKPTIEHTRMMNPTWDVTLKHYTKDQLENYGKQNDDVLVKSYDQLLQATTTYRKNYDMNLSYSSFVDDYKRTYVKFSENPVVYLDLDTICISPFDDFFIPESMSQGTVTALCPCWRRTETKKPYQRSGDWSIVTNIKLMAYNLSFILKNIDLSKSIINYYGYIMNEGQQAIYDRRSEDFHLNKIDYSKYEPIANKQLSPDRTLLFMGKKKVEREYSCRLR